ncbi:hypothetical protein K290105B7_09690 [Anaerostipes caccae]|nr:hypothetical protein ANCC_10220 [Anaerostipes caccae L1-92]
MQRQLFDDKRQRISKKFHENITKVLKIVLASWNKPCYTSNCGEKCAKNRRETGNEDSELETHHMYTDVLRYVGHAISGDKCTGGRGRQKRT